MGLNRSAVLRALSRLAAPMLGAALLAMAIDGWRCYEAARLVARVAAAAQTPPHDDDPPELRFVRAAQLEQAGQVDAALNTYRELQSNAELGQAARYNAANVLMRQAAAVKDASNAGQALPLVELAKQGYRDVLRHDPAHWDARYNLERAQRLQPEPEDMDAPITEPRNDAERAATTMRGVAPGLP